MGAPAELHELVEQFDRNKDAYKSGDYNETQARGDFIDPLMGLLGWDVHNRQGKAPAYRDVKEEDQVKVGGGTKAPDYGFYAGGERRFFLEAKKPSVDIAGDLAPAVQVRRYAWSAKLSLSILTDFEEFAIYDCRHEPSKEDKPATARLELITFDQYADRWDDISGLFSREAVLGGSLEKYAEANRKRRGTETVDAAFLREIEGWRSALARDLAARNDLNTRQLNYAVQMTIDRLIFLRMAEDRGIEDYGKLLGLTNGTGVYGRLVQQFRDADDRYNSGLFHFRNERGRSGEPDDLTPNLKIEDEVLGGIIRSLYYPESPYEFSVLPVDVLGQVYEQFLGSVIHLEDGHIATVEQKPEVRKAGGVYYTPTYIVDYIVENTIGKLLAGKKPGPRGGASKLKIVDPACGSGSFLIGAYEYLLDWHRDCYLEDGPEKWSKQLYEGNGGQWHLTIDEKKRILLNNIHGVDIDPQAVEVTKLSLLIKVLEGESEQSLQTQLRMFQERALPDLRENIKCGNSLIGPDFYENEQMVLLDEEEHYRINVFDWQDNFPQVFEGEDAGFDAVIGNPPYVGFHGFKREKGHLKRRFISAQGKFDLYLPFVEKGLDVLRPEGLLGYICPTNFTKREHGKAIRRYIAEKVKILEIVDFGDVQIFSGALNYTGIFTLQNITPHADHKPTYRRGFTEDNNLPFLQAGLSQDPWVFRSDSATKIVEKLESISTVRLGDMTIGISEGIVTGKNSVFLLPRKDAENLGLENEMLQPCVRGRQIHRYWIDQVEEVVIYPYTLSSHKTTAVSEEMLRTYPNTWRYLSECRENLKGRSYFEASSKKWYELWCQRDLEQLSKEKILVPELAQSNRFALGRSDQFYGDTVCGITLRGDVQEELLYILGLLNSRLIEFFFTRTTVPKANGFYIYKTMFLKKIPIRRIDFSDSVDRERHDQLILFTKQILGLHEQAMEARTPQEKTVTGQRINAQNRTIDQLVYELYSLTTAEIEIVEETKQ